MAGQVRAHESTSKGRPSKGERRALLCRVPLDLADEIADSAGEQGVTVSEYLADLLAASHGYPTTKSAARRARRRRRTTPVATTPGADRTVQEELPMQTAS